MKSFLSWFKQFFEEDNGKPSSKRLFACALFVVFIISYFKIAIPSQKLMDIPDNWAMLLGGTILGLGAFRKFMDRKKS